MFDPISKIKTKIGSSIDNDIVLLGDVSSCCHDQNSDHGNMIPFLDLPMTDCVQTDESLNWKKYIMSDETNELEEFQNEFKSVSKHS